MYGVHKIFHGEWKIYVGDFRLLGFAPVGNIKYSISNGGDGLKPDNYPRFLKWYTGQFSTKTYCANRGIECGWRPSSVDSTKAIAPTATTFKVGAAANFDGANIDEWTIDQDKTLLNEVDGF